MGENIMVCCECGLSFFPEEDNGVVQNSNNGRLYVCSECLYNCANGGCG